MWRLSRGRTIRPVMGGSIAFAVPRGWHANKLICAAALALAALCVPFAGKASAATQIVAPNSGMTLPAGVAVTTGGDVWVSDGVRGVCRVATEDSKPTLVTSTYCVPETNVDPADAAGDPSRPVKTLQMGYDPASSNLYVAEGSSKSSGIWRMHVDDVTDQITSAEKIFSTGTNRIFGLAVTPAGDLIFSEKGDTVIRKLSAPATGRFLLPTTVGTAMGNGAVSLAQLKDTVYIADENAAGDAVLTKIGPGGGPATEVTSLPAKTAPTALVADNVNDRLYIGTNNRSLVDPVLVLSGDTVEPYSGDYTFVVGMGVDSNGDLYIADDPPTGAGAIEAVEQSRLFMEPLHKINLPRVELTERPEPAQQSGDLHFAFASRPTVTTYECQLDGEAVPCGPAEGGPGGTYDATVAEGNHTFAVRALEGADAGPLTSWSFSVDRTPPHVSIDNDPTEHAVGGAIRMRFSAGEFNVFFECRLDGGEWAECSPPVDLRGLAFGTHVFEVRGTDVAGNPSEPVSVPFQAVPQPPPPAPPAPPAAPAPPAVPATPAAPAAGNAATPRRPTPRIEIGTACIVFSPSRARGSYRIARGRVVVRFTPPRGAGFATFTLRRAASRRRAKVIRTLRRVRLPHAGAQRRTFRLTRSERSTLRRGRARIAVAYGSCASQVGRWRWLQTTSKNGSHR